jgi:hypothetical protein
LMPRRNPAVGVLRASLRLLSITHSQAQGILD